jgi:hypothetical protein
MVVGHCGAEINRFDEPRIIENALSKLRRDWKGNWKNHG